MKDVGNRAVNDCLTFQEKMRSKHKSINGKGVFSSYKNSMNSFLKIITISGTIILKNLKLF